MKFENEIIFSIHSRIILNAHLLNECHKLNISGDENFKPGIFAEEFFSVCQDEPGNENYIW